MSSSKSTLRGYDDNGVQKQSPGPRFVKKEVFHSSIFALVSDETTLDINLAESR
jgi:hypothetical protein